MAADPLAPTPKLTAALVQPYSHGDDDANAERVPLNEELPRTVATMCSTPDHLAIVKRTLDALDKANDQSGDTGALEWDFFRNGLRHAARSPHMTTPISAEKLRACMALQVEAMQATAEMRDGGKPALLPPILASEVTSPWTHEQIDIRDLIRQVLSTVCASAEEHAFVRGALNDLAEQAGGRIGPREARCFALLIGRTCTDTDNRLAGHFVEKNDRDMVLVVHLQAHLVALELAGAKPPHLMPRFAAVVGSSGWHPYPAEYKDHINSVMNACNEFGQSMRIGFGLQDIARAGSGVIGAQEWPYVRRFIESIVGQQHGRLSVTATTQQIDDIARVQAEALGWQTGKA